MTIGKPISAKQRAEILRVYYESDGAWSAIRPLLIRYDLNRGYVKNLRWRLKLPSAKKPRVAPPKYEDPRWKWAKERGAISI